MKWIMTAPEFWTLVDKTGETLGKVYPTTFLSTIYPERFKRGQWAHYTLVGNGSFGTHRTLQKAAQVTVEKANA